MIEVSWILLFLVMFVMVCIGFVLGGWYELDVSCQELKRAPLRMIKRNSKLDRWESS